MRRMIDWIGKSAEDRGRDDDARRSAIERASGATERRTRPRRDPRRSRVDRGRRRTVSVSADVGPATSIPLILRGRALRRETLRTGGDRSIHRVPAEVLARRRRRRGDARGGTRPTARGGDHAANLSRLTRPRAARSRASTVALWLMRPGSGRRRQTRAVRYQVVSEGLAGWAGNASQI